GSTALAALQHRSAQDDTGECSHHKKLKAEAMMTSAFVLLMIPLFPHPHGAVFYIVTRLLSSAS
ncbi:MAG: hypothetical protein II330_05110, partial [Clostridia bacterium]|nr:hypothetical protein [Clostridia bacterium]